MHLAYLIWRKIICNTRVCKNRHFSYKSVFVFYAQFLKCSIFMKWKMSSQMMYEMICLGNNFMLNLQCYHGYSNIWRKCLNLLSNLADVSNRNIKFNLWEIKRSQISSLMSSLSLNETEFCKSYNITTDFTFQKISWELITTLIIT